MLKFEIAFERSFSLAMTSRGAQVNTPELSRALAACASAFDLFNFMSSSHERPSI